MMSIVQVQLSKINGLHRDIRDEIINRRTVLLFSPLKNDK